MLRMKWARETTEGTMKKHAAILMAMLTLSGCASTYRPVVDPTIGRDNYEQDLLDCRKLAGDDARAGVGAVIGGLAGAAISTLAFVGSGLRADHVHRGMAAVGAIAGGLGAMKGQRDVIARCMAGRGYSVLE